MRVKAYGIGIGLAVATFVATSVGAFAMESPETFMHAVNKDADKTISMEEVDAYAMRRFDDLDTEKKKDGTLSKAEIGDRMTPAEFAEANTRHKSDTPTLSRAEFKAWVDKLFVEANVSVKPGHTAASGTLSERELATPAGEKLIRLLE